MDSGWSLGFGLTDPTPHTLNRPVGLFLDLASLWVTGDATANDVNGGLKRPDLHLVADELLKLAKVFTSRSEVNVRHCVVPRGQLSQDEDASLESLAFDTDPVANSDEAYEVLSNAILLWLWDNAASQDASSPPCCVTVVTSNEKFGPLLTKLRRRNVFVLLISELSGSGDRHPVGLSLRKDATVLYDFNEICLLLERFGLKTSQSGDPNDGEAPPGELKIFSRDEIENDSNSWQSGGEETVSNEKKVAPGNEITYPSRCKSFGSMVSVDSEATLDGLDGLDMDAQSLDLRLATALPESLSTAIGGAGDAARLLSLPRSGGLTRSPTCNIAIQQLEAHVKGLEAAWTKKNVTQVARLLRRFARAGYNVQPYVRRLILEDDASNICLKPSGTDSPAATAPLGEGSLFDAPGEETPVIVHATTFGFVLECVRDLYERYKSIIAPIPSISSLSSLENSTALPRAAPPPVTTSPSAIRRGADALDASHVLISALEGCSIGELNEELHRTAVDLVHSLLDRAPAFTQADRLLRIVGVPEHLPLVLQPYVEKWMKAPNQSASAQAFSFAYRSGLMDALREKQVNEIDGRIPLAMLQQQGQRQQQPNENRSAAIGNLASEDASKDDDDGWYIGSSLETSVDHGLLPRSFLPAEHEGNCDQDDLIRKSKFEIRGCGNASTDSLSGMMLQAIEPISALNASFGDCQLGMPRSVQERVMELLVRHKEGLLGSDVPRLYSDEYGERLVMPQNPLTKERMKLKDFLLSIKGVGTYTRNTQPVFVAIAPWGDDLAEDMHTYPSSMQNQWTDVQNSHLVRQQRLATLPMVPQEPFQPHLLDPHPPSLLMLQQQQQQQDYHNQHQHLSSVPPIIHAHNESAPNPTVDRRAIQKRLARLLQEGRGILGAQLPSKYLETYGIALSLEADDGSKAKKLKEYLLSDEMTALLRSQEPPLKIVLTKAGHDRRYTVEPLNEQWQ